jgi:hypothetical protein
MCNYETVKDFYTVIGKFETGCYENSNNFSVSKFVVKYGNLPILLKQTLMLGGSNGIKGYNAVNIKKGL